MNIFVVGGAVRDVMLGNIPKDIDYVVVGATPEEMISQGFKQVGADFPVFLHPETGDEYALARTERKSGVGYKGFETIFDPSITIEDDLKRRDLTINSMAVRIEDWESFQLTKCNFLVIDPHGGMFDLECGFLFHTSEAFAEDPIRVLRTARFAARYNFSIVPKTKDLMKEVVHELNHVPTERIWTEFEKGLVENHPEKMVEVLREVGAFDVDIMKPYNQASAERVQRIKHHVELDFRFTAIADGFADIDYETHRIPIAFSRLSKAVHKFGKDIIRFHTSEPAERLAILEKLRALNNSDFTIRVFYIAHVLFDGRQDHMPSMVALMNDMQMLKSVDVSAIAAECNSGNEIKERLFNARLEVLS